MKTRFHDIAPSQPCYLIAELSHNHQADGAIALRLIEAAAGSGAHAVKFQKRNNVSLYSSDYLAAEYKGPNSFGKTYGEHRETLEPQLSWLLTCKTTAHRLGLDFIMTVFDLESLAFCEQELEVDAYKIQSGDLSYPELIRAVAATGKPYFISCGAATFSEIKAAWNLCVQLSTPFLMMYAVSAYPTATAQVNLVRIGQLQAMLNGAQLGFSCHFPGIEPALIARALGALAIEKHFTLDRLQTGPDHAISLVPSELQALRTRLCETDTFMGVPFQKKNAEALEEHQRMARFKMGKSPVALRSMGKGAMVQRSDIRYISPAAGLSPVAFEMFSRTPLMIDIKAGEYFEQKHFI